jgi:hypothetical protein
MVNPGNAANAGGLGNYGVYNGTNIDKAAFDAIYGTNHGGTLTQTVVPLQTNTVAGGLGNYGTYNGVGIDKNAFNTIYGTQHGGTLTQTPDENTSGALDYANTAIEGLGVLGNLYFADKNQKLKEKMYDAQKKAIAQSDARKTKFANRVGGSY